MKIYNNEKPLIVIHVPKAAGTSSQQIFRSWFKNNFHRHYYNENEGLPPKKINLNDLHSPGNPLVLHGHFNKLRGFGVEDYYPEIDQFITILRDPFELSISHYFFVKKQSRTWKDQSRVPENDLHSYLENTKPNMLNHFPREMNLNNYKDIIEELFIEIGITEKLAISLQRIAKKLGYEFDENQLQRLNSTERDEKIPDSFREQFHELNPLEFSVYEYALSKYN